MKHTRSFIGSWCIWFLLFSAALTALLLPLLNLEDERRAHLLKAHQRQHIAVAETRIKDMFHERFSDLQVLANSPVFNSCQVHEDEDSCSLATRMLQDYCSFYGVYDQLRLIGRDGQETIRINRDGGQCMNVPPAELKMGAGKLPADKSHISPLYLSVEHGALEKPHKPIIRFSAPVVNSSDEIGGVIVLNYLAAPLLDQLFINRQQGDRGNISKFLVNDQGYYLKSTEFPGREFAFMFGHDLERFSIDYQDAWQAARSGKNNIKNKEGIFLIQAVDVPVNKDRSSTADADRTHSSRWYIVDLIHSSTLHQTSLLHGPKRWVWYTLYLLALALVSNLWTRTMESRANRIADQKVLMQLYRRNELLLTSSGEGIFGLDLQGRITFANPAAEKLLGWTANEMIGKNSHELFHYQHQDGAVYPAEKCPSCIALKKNTTQRVSHEVYWHKDKTPLPVSYTASSIVDEGKITGVVIVFQDTSEQNRLITEQEAREAQLRTITDASHDAILMMNPKGEISFWNPAAENILGYTADEALGRDLHRLIVPKQHWSAFDTGFTGFLKTGIGPVIGQTLEHTAVHKNGHHIPVSISLGSVLLEDQYHAVGVIRDDTERTLAMKKEEELRREERSLLALFDKGDTLLFKWNNDYDLTTAYVSENVYKVLEIDRLKLDKRPILYNAFIHPDDLAAFTEKFSFAVTDRLDFFTHEPYRIISGSGKIRWILNHTVTQKNEAGEITHFIGYLSDITRQKMVEERAIKLKEEFETIFNTVPIPIAYVSDRGEIYRRNEAFINLTGYSKQDVPDYTTWLFKAFPDDTIRNEATARWNSHVEVAQKTNGIIRSDLYMVTSKDGTVRPLAAGGKIIKDGLIATLIDMSEEETAKQALINAREEADSANLAKTRFLANMSHEFRTPLNSIIGLTQMLVQRQGLLPDVREEVDNIHTSGQMLLTLVNDILDLSKIEAGEINFEMIPMQFSTLFSELRAMLHPQTKKKGIDLIFGTLPAAVEGHVISDPTRLRQILLNLLTNAVKFTNLGTVSLSIQSVGSFQKSDGGPLYERLRIAVQDSGCGIPADLLPNLFDAFRQADSSITRKYGGTGLGLAIVKQLTEGMGGEVFVESTVGEGSCFSIELPLRLATDDEVKAAGLDMKHFHILLAEDEPVHRNVLQKMCRQLGWDVETASQGMKLSNRYEELLGDGVQIDCIIIDRQMPEPDELSALSRIQEKYGAGEPPGILVIRSTERKQSEQYHLALPHLIVNRPLSIADLINGMGQIFREHSDDPDLVLRSTKLDFTHLAWLPDVKILVVDDAQTNLDLAVKLFGREGAEVYTCMDGAEALEWLQAPENRVDIVLMDIQMPLMDGNTAVKEIRKNEKLKDLPVIALSAAALASERQISLDAGMDEYQTKPYDTEKMVRLIRKHVGRAKAGPVPVRGKRENPPGTRSWPTIEGVEIQESRERLNDDLDLFMNLLHRFATENRDLLHPQLLPAGQVERAALQARMHKLAGSTGLIGIVSFSGLTKRIENCLRDGEEEKIPELLTKLRENFTRMEQAIASALNNYSKSHRNDEPPGPGDVEVLKFREALQHKKIASMKMYRELQPALQLLMTDYAYQGLDASIAKLDFAGALQWLDELDTTLDADSRANEDDEA